MYIGVWPDGYVGGPVVKRGAYASLRGCIAVNDQCLAAKVHGFRFSCSWQWRAGRVKPVSHGCWRPGSILAYGPTDT